MILMYHKVHPNTPSMWWVSVNDFYRQMSEIAHKKVVYLEDYDVNDPTQVVITFDGIYKNVLEFALPIMQHYNYPFELFLTSDYLGLDNEFDSVEPNAPFTTPAELQELVKGGGRLQWHTRSHINLKNEKDTAVIINELTIPEEVKNLDPNGFTWFAYPHGEFNETVVEEVKKRFNGAVSCNQGNDTDKYILNRLTVVNKTSLRDHKIACIVASYNYGAYLIEAVESVLRQTVLPDEILISDDCSDDETQLIAETYVSQYPKLISYNRNPVNMGIVDHFNKAISLTKSEYVFFLGADNRLLSNYVEESAKVLDSAENIGIAYTDYAFFGSRAKKVYEGFGPERQGKIIADTFYQIHFPEFDNREALLNTINQGNFIHGSSMFKRTAYDQVGGYQHSATAEDYNLFRSIVTKGWDIKKVKATNLEYRQHSQGQANSLLSLQNRMLFYKKSFLQLRQSKNSFESSKLYKVNYKLFVFKNFVKKNLKNPKAIASKIIKFIKK